MEWNSYFSNACYECGNWGVGFQLTCCKSCRAVSFCAAHLKFENPRHKDLCKVLTQFRGNSPSVFTNSSDWSQDSWFRMKTNLMLISQLKLGRKLTKQEEEVLKFPKKCVCCFEIDFAKLTDCQVCPSTSFCSNHVSMMSQHSERCQKLTECAASDVFFSPMLRREIPAIPEGKTSMKLPEDMRQFISMCGPNSVMFPHNVQTSASSELYSRPLSLLYAIEKLGCKVGERLVVHVVGASPADLEDPSTFEIILHLRPSIMEMLIVFVGPELEGIEVPSMTPYLCNDCKKNDVRLDVKIEAKLYHNYVPDPLLITPALAIGYNAGIHEFADSDADTWSPTVKLLGHLNWPFVVTSYTMEEARRDEKRILSGAALTVVFHEKNPFGSLRHYRDFENDEFYYQNQFILGFRRREEEVCLGMMEMSLGKDRV